MSVMVDSVVGLPPTRRSEFRTSTDVSQSTLSHVTRAACIVHMYHTPAAADSQLRSAPWLGNKFHCAPIQHASTYTLQPHSALGTAHSTRVACRRGRAWGSILSHSLIYAVYINFCTLAHVLHHVRSHRLSAMNIAAVVHSRSADMLRTDTA